MNNLPCPPVYWPRFSSLLDSALDIAPADRRAWLDQLDGEDALVKPWLTKVLGNENPADSPAFMAPPSLPDTEFTAGARIGPYILAEKLGQGGMGAVWRVLRQDDGPRRDLALKLPHRDLLSPALRQRFAREGQMLARLSHPHIGHLYDAGVAEDGHPFMALELVLGQPITDYCRKSAAPLERRVALVRQVLGALSYAHQRLIVHRDIKPSNVLVTAEGWVKLLDFGIARMLGGDTAELGPALTQPLAPLATPGYAAPEQFSGGAVTVATDLFSVGILLFELVTGCRPFAATPRSADAAPARLASQMARAELTGAPEGAALARRLRGDLDAVIGKSLALDATQRYASAEAFSRDLERWAKGLPVTARRIGWLLRGQKFVRRNRLAAGLSAFLALALVAGTGGIAWQAQVAAREAARANAIKNFLIRLFEQENPNGLGKPDHALTARELVDIGAARADHDFAGDPETEIELLETLGKIYDSLTEGGRAEAIWARRLKLMRAIYGEGDPRIVRSTLLMASSLLASDRQEEGRSLLESVRGPIFRRYGDHSAERAEWLDLFGASFLNQSGASTLGVANVKAAIAIYAAYYPKDDNYLGSLQDLSFLQEDDEDYTGALATLDAIRQVAIAQQKYDSILRLALALGSGQDLEALGRLSEADASFAATMDLALRLMGNRTGYYLNALCGRARIAGLAGRRDQSEAFYRQVLAIPADSGEAADTAHTAIGIHAAMLAREGNAAAALPLLREALARPTSYQVMSLRLTGALGDTYDQLGQVGAARAPLRAARDGWMQKGPSAGRETLEARNRWARFLLEHGDIAAAAAEFRAVLALQPGLGSAAAAQATAGLARVAQAEGALGEADTLSAQALHFLAATQVEYDQRLWPDLWLTRGRILLGEQKVEPAWLLATKALRALSSEDFAMSPRRQRGLSLLADIQKALAGAPPGAPSLAVKSSKARPGGGRPGGP